jgi:hypothetical protein
LPLAYLFSIDFYIRRQSSITLPARVFDECGLADMNARPQDFFLKFNGHTPKYVKAVDLNSADLRSE